MIQGKLLIDLANTHSTPRVNRLVNLPHRMDFVDWVGKGELKVLVHDKSSPLDIPIVAM